METKINTEVYDRLGERWYSAFDDPIALLRAQSRLRNPWIIEILKKTFDANPCQVLDIGCGAGFLSNELARQKHHVTGIDLSEETLEVARRHDETRTVNYMRADATNLPFEDARFEVVCAMDFLEHVESPAVLIREISRVLKPGGLFFFHTFNRNPLSGLLAIKLLEWFVRNTPKNMHIYRLFIKPPELGKYCADAGLDDMQFIGLKPVLWTRKNPFGTLKAFSSGSVPKDFRFEFTPSLAVGYSGYARRRNSQTASQ